MWAVPGVTQTPSLEYAVKAAYLHKFAPFVEWPAAAYDSPTSPFEVCVAGDEPFGPALDKALDGQRVGQHPVAVRRLARVDGRASCHVLYVAGSEAQSVADALSAVRGKPVLTVTDERSSGPARGVIHFVIDAKRVRFHIDDQAAASHDLTVSSKLLSLALSVRAKS